MDVVTLGAALAISGKKTTEAIGSLAPGYTYKGSVASVADLPSGAETGDLYTVGGTQYVWDGTQWINMSITNSQIDALFE